MPAAECLVIVGSDVKINVEASGCLSDALRDEDCGVLPLEWALWARLRPARYLRVTDDRRPPLSVRSRSSIAADRIYRLLTPKAVPKVFAGHLRRDRTAVLTERAQNDVQQASAEAVRGLFRVVAVEAAQSFAPQRRSLS